MSQDDHDTTTTQEYVISGIVIVFFGILYWYLSNGFNFSAQDDVQKSALTTVQVDSSSRLDSSTEANPLIVEPTAPNVALVPKSSLNAEALTVADTKTVVPVLVDSSIDSSTPKDAAIDVAMMPVDAPNIIEDVVQKSEKTLPENAETIANVNGQLESVNVNTQVLETEVQALASGEETPEELIYKLPNGTPVEIATGGFEEKFRRAIIEGKKDEPIIFDRVYFDTGSKSINAKSANQIAATAAILNMHSMINIVIRGHSDNEGSSQDNSLLSLIRSGSMKKALVKHGIHPARIRIEGVGEVEPIDSNKTKRGRRNNRRIDLIIKD